MDCRRARFKVEDDVSPAALPSKEKSARIPVRKIQVGIGGTGIPAEP
jgi:hypothetical protein